MNTTRIDLVNIGLMLLSLILALKMPFELFLFSFIVLGPLHYMTEIGWLQERDFFTEKKKDYRLLVGLCVAVGILIILFELMDRDVGLPIAEYLGEETLLKLKKLVPAAVFIGLITALTHILFQKWSTRIIIIGIGIILAVLLSHIPWYLVIFGVMIPTVIHASFFTGAFILQGALKHKQLSGYLSFIVFVLASAVFFFVEFDWTGYKISQYASELFLESEFYSVNYNLYLMFFSESPSKLVLDSTAGLQIQGYIAFAYTYHYLNWFSKTEVIKWHKISRNWLVTTIIICVTGVGITLYDIRLGMTCLVFISLVHVFLEFPLNHRSFLSIGKELKSRISGSAVRGKG